MSCKVSIKLLRYALDLIVAKIRKRPGYILYNDISPVSDHIVDNKVPQVTDYIQISDR